ncbi:unnamed protein product [Durusdinium trenchii]|uniref:cellulose 1,4-beta-cellobiosidase (non-reducing end) n=1 Tax=Durusdinium trenchii TaxID=1381693 RepID=A0ABP0NKK1_9DINO
MSDNVRLQAWQLQNLRQAFVQNATSHPLAHVERSIQKLQELIEVLRHDLNLDAFKRRKLRSSLTVRQFQSRCAKLRHKCKKLQAEVDLIEASRAINQEEPPAIVVSHLHDEASLKLRSFDLELVGWTLRARCSKVQNEVVHVKFPSGKTERPQPTRLWHFAACARAFLRMRMIGITKEVLQVTTTRPSAENAHGCSSEQRAALSSQQVRAKATKQKGFYNDKLGTVVNVLANDNFKVLLEEGDKKGEKRKCEVRFLTTIVPDPAAELPEGSELDAKLSDCWEMQITFPAQTGLDTSKYETTYGVTQIDGGVKLGFVTGSNVGSRLYLLEDENYKMFKLKNREFAVDVDASQVQCGMNGAMYFVEMDAAGGKGLGSNKALRQTVPKSEHGQLVGKDGKGM